MLSVYDWQQDTLLTYDDLADTRVFRCCAYDPVADQCPLHAEKCVPCFLQACVTCNQDEYACPICKPYVCCCGHDDDDEDEHCQCELCRLVSNKHAEEHAHRILGEDAAHRLAVWRCRAELPEDWYPLPGFCVLAPTLSKKSRSDIRDRAVLLNGLNKTTCPLQRRDTRQSGMRRGWYFGERYIGKNIQNACQWLDYYIEIAVSATSAMSWPMPWEIRSSG